MIVNDKQPIEIMADLSTRAVTTPAPESYVAGKIGSDGRDRTYDQLINSQLLYR